MLSLAPLATSSGPSSKLAPELFFGIGTDPVEYFCAFLAPASDFVFRTYLQSPTTLTDHRLHRGLKTLCDS